MNTVHSVWKKVDRRNPEDCWPWTGYVSGGRGRLDIGNIPGVYASRAAYVAAFPGELELTCTDGRYVLHSCDNPLCCNPAHLRIGTHSENMQDKVLRSRCPDFKGTKGPRAKLSAEDVRAIRRSKKGGATKKALALLYEVSEATISGACYGRHYQDVI